MPALVDRCVRVGQAHRNTVAGADPLDVPAENLHRADAEAAGAAGAAAGGGLGARAANAAVAGGVRIVHPQTAADCDDAAENDARHDGPAAVHCEAVVDGHRKVRAGAGAAARRHSTLRARIEHARRVPRERARERLDAAWLARPAGHSARAVGQGGRAARAHKGHMMRGEAAPLQRAAQPPLQSRQRRAVEHSVDLVQRHDQTGRDELTDDEALGRLRLHALARVYDKQHDVHDARPEENGAN